ncbi:hypothetical protein QO010_003601 [Caulobacter ginsengisoli]|uniref:Protein-glutamine gamma-glutamyltransferase-like C-terminal domain-containing protein n=1 Tax=Caulobacter ginsengisoli TaxID=400775 RepID=A0ABU0IXN2_9CAUL|nr:DUF4129 domain-containing protein [Caulobacter ginsengisoli]MDQ0465809.1 hypothetical protein [Caulobacter ginsengisoli]
MGRADSVTSGANGTGGASAEAVARAHERLLHDKSLQFDFPPFQMDRPPEPKGNGLDLSFLEPLGKLLGWAFWIGLAVVVLLLLWVLVGEGLAARWGWTGRRKAVKAQIQAEFRPDQAKALVLLEDADALAAKGRYDEAAHLLLLRGVEDIHGKRPGLVKPALTSRDIAALPELPEAARPAFMTIAQVVERSLFGGHAVDAAGWRQCRDAYEAFVFPEAWR